MKIKDFFRKKWRWFLLIGIITIGTFLYFWFKKPVPPLEEILPKESGGEEIVTPVSSVYRYDFNKKEYLPDQGKSWQNANFSRYIYDSPPPGLKLEKCYYLTYDNLRQQGVGGGERRCNSNLIITIGEGKSCSSQGENVCTLYVYALDNLGRQGEMTALSYHIDWEKPKVGKIYQEDGKFLAEVSDNLEVGYCWFYLNRKNVGSMRIKNGLASLEYSISGEESYNAFVRCADHYDIEKEGYLNLASGELTEFIVYKNQPPKISFCRVVPTQGTIQTEFQFKSEATDPDGDPLSYLWDFGDGKTYVEQNPKHSYSSLRTFEPKVKVFDGQGGEDNCATAWVSLSQ